MNEEQLKSLLKDSEIHASDGFTDRLMLKMETKETYVLSLRYAVFTLTFLLLGMGLFLYFGGAPSFSIVNIEIAPLRTPLFIGLIFLVLIGMNKVLSLYDTIHRALNE